MMKTILQLQSDMEKLEGERKEAARKKFGSPDVDSDTTELLLLSRPLQESQGTLDALKEDLNAQQKHMAVRSKLILTPDAHQILDSY